MSYSVYTLYSRIITPPRNLFSYKFFQVAYTVATISKFELVLLAN